MSTAYENERPVQLAVVYELISPTQSWRLDCAVKYLKRAGSGGGSVYPTGGEIWVGSPSALLKPPRIQSGWSQS